MKTTFTKQTMLSGLPMALLCCLLTLGWSTAQAGGGPANDLCGGATVLTPGSTCTFTAVDPTGATASPEASLCTGTPDDDVWFSFVAISSEATITVDGNADYDAVIEVSTGSCGALTLVPSCVDNTLDDGIETADLTGLTIGATYYVRVYDWYTGFPTGGAFDICLVSTAPCDMTSADGRWPSATIAVGAEGVVTSITTAAYEGSEYSELSGFIAGNFYEVNHEAGSYATVREGAVDGPVVASGFAPLQFTATSTANLFVHWTVDADCNTSNACCFDTDVTNLGLPPCDMSGENGQYPFSAVAVDAGGALTVIAGDQYDGSEYSQITAIQAGHSYEFTHENGAYVTVYSGGVTGSLVGSGFSPLTIVAPNTDDLYVHWTLDAACTVGTDLGTFYETTVQDVTPAGYLCDLAIPIICGETASGSTAGANTATGLATCTTSLNTAPGIWYEFAGNGQDVVATTCNPGTDFDTKMGVFSGDCNALTCVGGNDDAVGAPAECALGGLNRKSTVEFYAEPGVTYYVYVTGFGTAEGAYDLSISCTCPTADAGTLTADATPVCLDGGTATISATEATAPTVPVGYDVVYVLTLGVDLEIWDIAVAPNFIVTEGGDYTIHTLVYNSDEVDLGSLPPGTTGGDVAALIGSGAICGALDVPGAPITVNAPEVGVATVADASSVCLNGGSADIGAESDGNEVVPAGFALVYVLTDADNNLEILDANATGDFTVNAAGNYVIHSFVYDPNEVDLGTLPPGTTGGDVAALIDAGAICAALDVAGAPISVNAPEVGATVADASPVCLVGGSADIGAESDGNEVVPAGFALVYVLTDADNNLEILDANATGDFTVNAAGNYVIHTFVYDPNEVDLGTLPPGITGGDVAALIGSGAICAALDVTGAPITVNGPEVGATIADATPVCLDGGSADIGAESDGNEVIPAGFALVYVLTDADNNLEILDANATGDFTVNAAGNYVIHTFVYDPNEVDLGTLPPGITGGDVAALIGSGTICAALDVTGAPIEVEECTTAPANDLCGNAVSVSCGITIAGTTVGSTADDAPFGTQYVSEGVWYVLAGTGDDVTASTCDAADFDTEIVIATGSCGNLTYLANNDDDFTNCTGNTSQVTFSTQVGTDYYIYVGDYFGSDVGPGGNEGIFDLSITCTPPPPPFSNDEPCTAIALSTGANGPYTQVGATTSAWEDVFVAPEVGCTEQGGWCIDLDIENSAWYSFVAPASGSVTISTDGSTFDTQLAIFSGTCQDVEGGNGVVLGANDDDPDASGSGGSTLTSIVFLCDLTPGETYYVLVDGWNGAEGNVIVNVTENTLDAAFTSSTTGLTVDFTDASSASGTIASWAWDFGDGNSSTDEDPSHTYGAPGPYTVCLTVTDENGCTSEFCNQVVADTPVSIAEAVEGSMVVYPNPSNGQFTVEITGVEADVQLNVLDLAGRMVYTEGAVLNGNFRKVMNLDVATGTYLLQISTAEGVVTRKLQVQ